MPTRPGITVLPGRSSVCAPVGISTGAADGGDAPLSDDDGLVLAWRVTGAIDYSDVGEGDARLADGDVGLHERRALGECPAGVESTRQRRANAAGPHARDYTSAGQRRRRGSGSGSAYQQRAPRVPSVGAGDVTAVGLDDGAGDGQGEAAAARAPAGLGLLPLVEDPRRRRPAEAGPGVFDGDHASLPVGRTLTSIRPPAGVNLRALPTRFCITWTISGGRSRAAGRGLRGPRG